MDAGSTALYTEPEEAEVSIAGGTGGIGTGVDTGLDTADDYLKPQARRQIKP